jgi:prepilin-type N-terminal cleavage/methylation domain-containing protein
MVMLKLFSNRKFKRDSGFTLIESLVAIVVVAALVAGLTPFILYAVVSRVQARRADVAVQAARAYIDGVQSGKIPIPDSSNTGTSIRSLSSVPAPSISIVANQLIRVDTDGNGRTNDLNDVVIQAIRNGDNTTATSTTAQRSTAFKKGFGMVVRVYRSDAFSSGSTGTVIGTLSTVPNSYGAAASSPTSPLVVMSSEVASLSTTPGDATSFDDYRTRLTCDSSICY